MRPEKVGGVESLYFDYNASTPIAKEVQAEMIGCLNAAYGNPSSNHFAGSLAKQGIERAREQVANLLGAARDEIVFTSGGTESANMAIKGSLFARAGRPGHIITTTIEHPATENTLRFAERLGFEVSRVSVDGTGLCSAADMKAAFQSDTFLVCLMHANNEVGTIQPIRDISDIAHERGAAVYVDAAQSVGKIPVNVHELGADLLSIAGHKFYAPKGVGALFVRSGITLEPLLHGGGHERGLRAGTESLILCGALGRAAELSERCLPDAAEVQILRDRAHDGLAQICGNSLVLNGHPTLRLPNTLNVSFVGHEGAEILERLEGVAASTGSACHEGMSSVSPVLKAMGVPETVARGAVRFSFGRATTGHEIDALLDRVKTMWSSAAALKVR